jgi:hypothetical protein
VGVRESWLNLYLRKAFTIISTNREMDCLGESQVPITGSCLGCYGRSVCIEYGIRLDLYQMFSFHKVLLIMKTAYWSANSFGSFLKVSQISSFVGST